MGCQVRRLDGQSCGLPLVEIQYGLRVAGHGLESRQYRCWIHRAAIKREEECRDKVGRVDEPTAAAIEIPPEPVVVVQAAEVKLQVNNPIWRRIVQKIPVTWRRLSLR